MKLITGRFFSAIAAAIALSSATAKAALLYSANFNSPTYSDSILRGQDGWINTSGSGTNDIAVSTTATNGFASLTTSGDDERRPFATSATDGSVFLSADIKVSAAQSSAGLGDYFIHLGDNSTSNFYARTYIQSSGAGFVMALGTSSGTAVTYGTTVLNFGTTYHILARYDFVSGAGNDAGALFINPINSMGIGDTPYVAATTVGTDATTISAVYLRQGAATQAPTLTIDNIAVNTLPVPEPSTLALCGVGLIGLVGIARRKNRMNGRLARHDLDRIGR